MFALAFEDKTLESACIHNFYDRMVKRERGGGGGSMWEYKATLVCNGDRTVFKTIHCSTVPLTQN